MMKLFVRAAVYALALMLGVAAGMYVLGLGLLAIEKYL
jgi:hypothetical protein